MPRLSHPIACAIAAGVLALPLALTLALPAWAAPGDKAKAEQADAKQKRADVHSKMEALSREQAATAAKRDRATADLARQANAVAVAAKALHDTDMQLAAKQKQLGDLQQQYASLQTSLNQQRAAVADLLRAAYTLGRGSDLRLLMGDDDIARMARALAYSRYFQQDRTQRVQQLMGDLTRLQTLETDIATQQQALEVSRKQRAVQAKALEQQRAAQAKLVAGIDAQYKTQAQRLAALKQNQAALDQLIGSLQKTIDEDAARAAKLAAQQAAQQAAQHGTAASPGTISGKGLTDIRGNLPWPTVGEVNTYGNGVLIKAPGGSLVHAVADGRVVYAAFLRGYGMLLILSHGDGWLSMYGNNETLLHGVGDRVAAGQTIGTAMAPTGVNTGVYFELRQNNKPVDPRAWLNRHR